MKITKRLSKLLLSLGFLSLIFLVVKTVPAYADVSTCTVTGYLPDVDDSSQMSWLITLDDPSVTTSINSSIDNIAFQAAYTPAFLTDDYNAGLTSTQHSWVIWTVTPVSEWTTPNPMTVTFSDADLNPLGSCTIDQSTLLSAVPPQSTLAPAFDSYISSANKNENNGASTFLAVQKNKRALVQFDYSAMQRAVGDSQDNYTATLVLPIASTSNIPTGGRQFDVDRLLDTWTEGNGFIQGNSTPTRGTGSGVTWNCATDSNILNTGTNCSGLTAWDMTDSSSWPFVSTPTATTTITNGQTGTVSLDVTSDVKSFLHGTNTNDGWIVKLDNESLSGKVDFGSRESGTPPQLIITPL